jgi:hypothetical protein
VSPATKIVVMLAFWALLICTWTVVYKVRPIRWVRNTFTMHRWGVNPFQMYALFFLLQVSLNQLVIGVPETSAQSALNTEAQIALATCTLIGCLVSAYGLHLRDVETALWIELSGYVSLAGSLGIWVYLVFVLFPLPNTSYGLAFAEAFVLFSIHRAVQIVAYKRAKRRGHEGKRAALLDQIEKSTPLD